MNDRNIIVYDVRSNEAVQVIDNNNNVSDIKMMNNDYIVAVSHQNNLINVLNYKTKESIKVLNVESNNCSVTIDPLNYNYILCAEYSTSPKLRIFSDVH